MDSFFVAANLEKTGDTIVLLTRSRTNSDLPSP
jgi:hypothetical protein